MWRYSDETRCWIYGVADFAGNATIASFIFTTAAPPPLVAEDRFESAPPRRWPLRRRRRRRGTPPSQQAQFCTFRRSPRSWPARPASGRPTLRLALDPGDAVIRFAYRTVVPAVSSTTGTFVSASYTLGSEAGQVLGSSPMLTSQPTTVMTIGVSWQLRGWPGHATAALAPPPDAAGEVTLVRTARSTGLLDPCHGPHHRRPARRVSRRPTSPAASPRRGRRLL